MEEFKLDIKKKRSRSLGPEEEALAQAQGRWLQVRDYRRLARPNIFKNFEDGDQLKRPHPKLTGIVEMMLALEKQRKAQKESTEEGQRQKKESDIAESKEEATFVKELPKEEIIENNEINKDDAEQRSGGQNNILQTEENQVQKVPKDEHANGQQAKGNVSKGIKDGSKSDESPSTKMANEANAETATVEAVPKSSCVCVIT